MLDFSENNQFNTTSAFCQAFESQSEHPLSPDFANECENFFSGNFEYFAKPCIPLDEPASTSTVILTTAAVVTFGLSCYFCSRAESVTQAEIEPDIISPSP